MPKVCTNFAPFNKGLGSEEGVGTCAHVRSTVRVGLSGLPVGRVSTPGGDDGDTEHSEVAEWGAFGFLYTLATLSFHDARPRGYSDKDFLPEDEFTVSDFFECLSYGHDGLHLRADYVHGRCMKTDITVRADGTATLETWGRGQTALRWLDRLQGKKLMGLV